MESAGELRADWMPDLFGEVEEAFCVFMADHPGDPCGQCGQQGHDPAP